MASKILTYGEDARKELLSGIEQLADAVAVTLGPRGLTVIMEKPHGGAPTITKDGVTVARQIELDGIPGMGARMIQEIASKTATDAGDGTTTATVLARSMMVEGNKAVAAGMSPMDLKRGMDKATGAVVEELKRLSIPCKENQAIVQVGTISANSDESIGKIIAKAVETVGQDGVITVEEGNSFTDELCIVEGMRFDRGYISPYFANNQKNMSCELENPVILMVDKKISAIREMLPLLEGLAKAGKSLFIIAEDVQGEALTTLALNSMRGVLKACAVKAPGFGDLKRHMMQDIATLIGANIISEEVGFTIESCKPEDLGSAKRVIVTKEYTTIIDGAGKSSKIQERIEQLKAEAAEAESDYDREHLKERVARLIGGVAVIKVGAGSETELKEKKDRVEDALHATRAAIEEGVVPGGGVALVRAIPVVKELKGDNKDQDYGISIILHALEAPLRQIVENACEDAGVVLQNVKAGSGNFGYNAATGEYGDMMELGILDPTKVTRTALQQAASVASLLITTRCTISYPPKKDKEEVPIMRNFNG